MTYIVVDLEWNQARRNADVVADSNGNRLYGEIIQIGAVKLSGRFKIKDEFKLNVKPKYYKVIHRKVRQITGIDQESLLRGEEFLSACKKFREWCGSDFAFLTWGPDDIRVLRRNIEMYGESSDWISKWYDVQSIYNMQTDTGDNQKSLSTAMEHFNIKATRPMHDALNDAYFTALVAEKLDMKKGIAELIRREQMRVILDESHPLSCEVYSGYKFRRDVLKDKSVSVLRCPECGAELLNTRPWVPERGGKLATLASCSEHGEYIARLSITKTGDVFGASKIVYLAGGGAEEFYEKRRKKNEVQITSRRRRSFRRRFSKLKDKNVKKDINT